MVNVIDYSADAKIGRDPLLCKTDNKKKAAASFEERLPVHMQIEKMGWKKSVFI